MPARKKHREGQKAAARPSWTLMIRADLRASEEKRIRANHPDVAKALDFMASRYDVYADGYGFTVFSDWILAFHPKASKIWPDEVPRVGAQTLWESVYPPVREQLQVHA